MRSIDSQNFSLEVLEEKEKLVLLDFWAAWCGPCQALAPKLEQLEEEFAEKIKVCKVNVDEQSNIAGQHMVTSIPTVILYRNGKIIASIIGNRPYQNLKEEVEKHLNR